MGGYVCWNECGVTFVETRDSSFLHVAHSNECDITLKRTCHNISTNETRTTFKRT